jgi:ketopantoate reductase
LQEDDMRILVVGAGAIGGFSAAGFSKPVAT